MRTSHFRYLTQSIYIERCECAGIQYFRLQFHRARNNVRRRIFSQLVQRFRFVLVFVKTCDDKPGRNLSADLCVQGVAKFHRFAIGNSFLFLCFIQISGIRIRQFIPDMQFAGMFRQFPIKQINRRIGESGITAHRLGVKPGMLLSRQSAHPAQKYWRPDARSNRNWSC